VRLKNVERTAQALQAKAHCTDLLSFFGRWFLATLGGSQKECSWFQEAKSWFWQVQQKSR
jgi:hypothetical protein